MALKTSKTGGNTGEKSIKKVPSDKHSTNSKNGQDKRIVGQDGKYSPKKSQESIKTPLTVGKYFIEACYQHLSRKY